MAADSSTLAHWVERCGRTVLRLAPAPVRDSWRDEVACTLREAYLHTDRTRGRTAAILMSAAELFDLARRALAARFGRRLAIVVDRGPARPPGRPGPMLFDDIVHAYRRLRSRPGLVLTAVAMLGLGIGLTTAMFTVVDALLLRPVPFRDAEHLAQLGTQTGRTGRTTVSPAVFRAWRDTGVFASVEGVSVTTAILETPGGLVAKPHARVSVGVFDMLGVRPSQGRLFDTAEGQRGGDDRVLLSEDVWRGAFGAAPDLVGSRITIDGSSKLVVGLMPSEFRFPAWNTVVWTPIDFLDPALSADQWPRPFVRFSPTVPSEGALARAIDAARAVDPAITAKTTMRSQAVAGTVMDDYYKRAMPLLAGGVGLVFLVLCANVCSLLLARLTARQREFSMCAALGASRVRLLRQAAIEHVALGAAGAVCGIVLAWALVSLSRGFLPEAFLLRTLNPVNLDARAVLAASAAGFVAMLLAGVLPAWIGTRPQGSASLRGIERGGTESRLARTVTRSLLVAEVALACTLLVGATLLVRSFVNLSSTPRGMDVEGVLTSWVSLPTDRFKDRASRESITNTLLEGVRTLPGIAGVALSAGLPPGGGTIRFGDGWVADTPGAASVSMNVNGYDVSPDFFDLYDIPLLAGRTFQPGDDPASVIVGERLAASLWPHESPIGRSFRFDKEQFQVIGLVREINLPSLDGRRDRPEMYEPFVVGGGYVYLNLRCAGSCPDEAVLRQRILDIVPGANIVRLGLLEHEFTEELARPRAAAALGFTFAAIAITAAAGGLFSVLSYAVGRRRREFGIRASLGATPASIGALVFREGARVAVSGVAIGSLAAWMLTRALSSLAYGVSGSDPATWLIVITLISVTTLAASWRPASVAMKSDPSVLLRED